MNLNGIIIGLATFLIIGVFHPIVIKSEYYFGVKIWPVFLGAGLLFIVLSLYINNVIYSSILGVTGFSALWSIKELKEQEERAAKGWFPKNPQKDVIE